jgi:DNA repair exonuclease SbcCD ATPase subunit
LQLGTASTDDTIPATSSLNNAFNITNARIKKEEDALAKEIQDRKDAINALTGTKDYSEHFDTMKEIADWLDANKDGVVDITLGVTANANAIKTEELRATAKETEITNALTEEADRATVAEQELQEQIDALGTAAKENKEYFATATQGSTADATAATIATYGDIVIYDAEDFVSKEEYDALLSDYNELKKLVEKLNNQINSP